MKVYLLEEEWKNIVFYSYSNEFEEVGHRNTSGSHISDSSWENDGKNCFTCVFERNIKCWCLFVWLNSFVTNSGCQICKLCCVSLTVLIIFML